MGLIGLIGRIEFIKIIEYIIYKKYRNNRLGEREMFFPLRQDIILDLFCKTPSWLNIRVNSSVFAYEGARQWKFTSIALALR